MRCDTTSESNTARNQFVRPCGGSLISCRVVAVHNDVCARAESKRSLPATAASGHRPFQSQYNTARGPPRFRYSNLKFSLLVKICEHQAADPPRPTTASRTACRRPMAAALSRRCSHSLRPRASEARRAGAAPPSSRSRSSRRPLASHRGLNSSAGYTGGGARPHLCSLVPHGRRTSSHRRR